MAKTPDTDRITDISGDTPTQKIEDYSIEPQGFWHRLDRRIERTSTYIAQLKFSKPFEMIGSGGSYLWNSRLMSPVRWVTSKAANAINSITKDPVMQFLTFAISLAFAIIAVVTAAPAALPLAATMLGMVAASKIIKTAHDARKSYRKEQLEKQLELLKTLSAIREARGHLLDQLPPETRKSIEPDLKKIDPKSPIHRRQPLAMSKETLKDILANLPGLISAGAHFSNIPTTFHTLSQVAKATSTARSAATIVSQPSSSQKNVSGVVNEENALRMEINALSIELQVPRVKDNSELSKFVADTAADTLALENLTTTHRDPSTNQSETFKKLVEQIKSNPDHRKSIEGPHKGASVTTHVLGAFLGAKPAPKKTAKARRDPQRG